MKPPIRQFRRKAGLMIAEMLIGTAVASIILGGLMIGCVSLQRAFSASDRLARTQADMIRVADYMARDIRNATSVNPSASGSVLFTVTTGDYYNRNGTPSNLADDVPNSPTIGRTSAVYGTSPVTIRYLRSGTGILREVSTVNAGATSVSTTTIADNVDELSVAVDASGTATISSASAMYFRIPKANSQTSSLSYVMASRCLNPTP